jgi:hypothetical protein
MSTQELVPLVITTAKNGVFFGYGVVPEGPRPESLKLERARMAVYWSEDMRGVVGLAAEGPSAACRISPAAPALTLYEISAVFEPSEGAVQRWESGPWKG